MKVPYEDISKICDLVGFAKCYDPDWDEADSEALCRIRTWLAARAKRERDFQAKRLIALKAKRAADKVAELKRKLRDEGIEP